MKLNLEQKVRFILARYPETRNSDIKLAIKLWEEFYNHCLHLKDGKLSIQLKYLSKIPKQVSITRVRGKIQNKEGLYIPTNKEVIRQRHIKESEFRKKYPKDDYISIKRSSSIKRPIIDKTQNSQLNFYN